MTATPTPSAVLSAEVVDILIAAGLLRKSRRDDLIAKIAAGAMKSDDWRLEVELAAAKTEEPRA